MFWLPLLCVSVILPSIALSSDASPFLDEFEANNFLSRKKRGNQFLEELSPGNQERECIEESCNREEAYEVFDDEKLGSQFWTKYLRCKSSILKIGENLTPQGKARIRISRHAGMNAREIKMLRDCVEDTDRCNPFPCARSNTERCESRITEFACICKPGFEGKKCQHHINECRSSPCTSFGTCEDEIGGFQCHCDDRHEGILCEKEITDCRVLGCGSYGTCLLEETYTCVCDEGFGGNNCDSDIDECSQSPCDHECRNTHGSFSCSCHGGYILDLESGTKCKDIDECEVTTPGCQHFCINTQGSFTCGCKHGYTLDAKFQRYCEDIDECQVNNGGCPIIEGGCGPDREPCKTCINRNGEHYCTCPPGFSHYVEGQGCQDIDECADRQRTQCQHECENYPGGYRCYCREGYKLNYNQKNCIDINECIGDHGCEYRCSNKPGTYECKCRRGYEVDEDGLRCRDFNECNEKNDCEHQCVNTNGSYTCSCNPGFVLSGRYSCRDFNECLSSPCGVNGRCINEHNKFRCECYSGFSGDNCEISDDPCSSNPCVNGACIVADDGFSCTCTTGFSGTRCEIYTPPLIPKCDEGHELIDGQCVDINECETASTCEHICQNTQGSYLCHCGDGFTVEGSRCKDVDECAQQACQQICQNSQGSFQCNCLNGYSLNEDRRTCTKDAVCIGTTFPKLTEDHILLGTKKSDFAELEIVSMPERFTIDFEFRTYDTDGVVFAMSSSGAERYFFAELRASNLFFGANFDGVDRDATYEKSDAQSIADGNWHRIVVKKKRSRLRISVDGQNKAIKAKRNILTDGYLYYGGIPATSALSSLVVTNSHLQGCIRRIQNDIETRSTNTSEHNGCFETIAEGTYFDGSGYVMLNLPAERDIRMRFTFKTSTGKGRLVTILGKDTAAFALDIDGGQIIAQVVGERGQLFSSVFTKANNQLLCDDIWHVCDFTIFSTRIRLHVDGVAAQVGGNSDMIFYRNSQMYLGGSNDRSVTSFTGSLGRIKINNVDLKLDNPIEMWGVHTHSIPYQ